MKLPLLKYQVLVLALAGAASQACGSHSTRTATTPRGLFGSCAHTSAPTGFTRVDAGGGGATIALAHWSSRTVAYVADEDQRAVYAIDVDTKKTLAKFPLEGRPAQLLLTSDGRLAVANRDRARVELFALGTTPDAPAAARCALETPTEPWGLALDRGDKTLLVTSAQGHALTSFDIVALKAGFSVELPREPRAVLISADEKNALVTHAAGGSLSVVPLADPRRVRHVATGEILPSKMAMLERGELDAAAVAFLQQGNVRIRSAAQGYTLAKSSELPGRAFAPQVLVDPGDPRRPSQGYGDGVGNSELPSVAVIDDRALEVLPASVRSEVQNQWFEPEEVTNFCLLPRSAAVDAKASALLVTCLGTDTVVAYELGSASPSKARRAVWRVPAGPTGIALDDRVHRMVVFSQFDRKLSVIRPSDDEAVDERAAIAETKSFAIEDAEAKSLSTSVALGRVLFHKAGDPRISADGRACASCHPDGRDDGLVWSTPRGPRRSIALAGRLAKTAPFAWDGKESEVQFHLDDTFSRLRGSGVHGSEREAIVAYLDSLPAAPKRKHDNAKLKRGREIFASAEAGCASCHQGTNLTDNALHDVGSKTSADRSPEFNTPSLLNLGAGGPYFHDGRYKSLRELLVAVDGNMGRTRHLSDPDMDALETYLESL